MPTYEYKCDECGIVFERFQHFSEEPVRICPECAGPVHRVIQPVGIIFKGKGFYVTDNKGDTRSLMPKADSDKSESNAAAKTTPEPSATPAKSSDAGESTAASSPSTSSDD